MTPVTVPAPSRRRGRAAGARAAATTGLLTLVTALPLIVASPAAALSRDDGDDPGAGLSALQTLGWFVGAPLGLFLLIVVAVYATNRGDDGRYRPGGGWDAAPVWFGGPEPDERPEDVKDLPARPTASGGGASAGW